MSARYLVSVSLFVIALAGVGAALGFVLPGVSALALAVTLAVLYPVGLAFDVLPPGRPRAASATDWLAEDNRAVPPPRSRAPAARGERPAAGAPVPPGYVAGPGAEAPSRPPVPAAVVVAGIGGLLLVGTIAAAAREGGGGSRAFPALGGAGGEAVAGVTAPPPPTVAGTPGPAQTATPTPPPATPTLTATPTPTATATEAPATPTAAPATPTPLPQPAPSQPQLQAGWMNGRWQITDTITQGPDAGMTFTFVVTLTEAEGRVAGSGDGLSLDGVRRGETVRLDFFRTGAAAGVFEWRVQPDGSLAGAFSDFGAANGGVSVARRLP